MNLPVVYIVDSIKRHNSVVKCKREGITVRLLNIGYSGIQSFKEVYMLVSGIYAHIIHHNGYSAPIVTVIAEERNSHTVIL